MIESKERILISKIRNYKSAVIAFSGGVDSTLLAFYCHQILGEKALALTAISSSMPVREREECNKLAQWIGIAHIEIFTHEFEDPDYLANSTDRCYFCKTWLTSDLLAYAKKNKVATCLEGSNMDDLQDHRPGRKALQQADFKSPFLESKMTKEDIRTLAKKAGLPNWNKPSLACLASRVPYGSPITLEKMKQIEQSESFLFDIGIKQARVRHHGEIARIEISSADFFLALENRKRIVEHIMAVGFRFVTLDLLGYRTGSMNPQEKI